MVGSNRPCVIATIVLAMILMSVVSWTRAADEQPNFVTSDQCIACHSNMVDESGKALSIGYTWRASLMALSAKDPYWQAAVRREISDRPENQAEIEDTCSVCHMPMHRTTAVANGGSGEVIRYVEGGFTDAEQKLAEDGVSCTVCHQISAENFGEHSSFSGGYVIKASKERPIFGPYEIDGGLQRVMQSASTMQPGTSLHVQQPELCATCHTLFTPAVDDDGNVLGEFPEQVPYLEWRHSAYARTESCQSCHMPEVVTEAPITSVLGLPRNNVSQHVFRGGNAFMLKILNTYRDELNVSTPVADLEQSIQHTIQHLQSRTAVVKITQLEISGSVAHVEIGVRNKAGHKLPTAYPSRRAWLHVTIRNANNEVIFESGALRPDGSIVGNDNDIDGQSFEPHHETISGEDQVQIYEPIVYDYKNDITTSLLAGVRYAKDNRLLPRGFDKTTADDAVSVKGRAIEDNDFLAGGDRVRYRIPLPKDVESITVSAELLFQTIGFRWAHNLEDYDSHETNRFVRYYEENASESAVVLAQVSR